MISQRAQKFFSRGIGNNRLRATFFSQRLLVKLHRYGAMIRGSKLLLLQVYFAVSLLPFSGSHQPKCVSFMCCSYFAKLRIVRLFSITKRFRLVYLVFVEVFFTRSIIAKACPVVKLLYQSNVLLYD